MAKRRGGQRATSIVDTILGEAVGDTKNRRVTPEQRWSDMVKIASTMINRANMYGVALKDVLTHAQYNAFGTALPAGVEKFRELAERALQHVLQNGPVTPATYYATPDAVKGLPKGLQAIDKSLGHNFYVDPKARPINTRVGTKRAVTTAQTPKTTPVPSSRPLDSIGGLGAEYRAAAQNVRGAGVGVAPSSPNALAGERFGQPASPALTTPQSIAQQAMERSWAGQTLADMLSGQNMPVDPRHPSLSSFPSIEKPASPSFPMTMQPGATITARPGSLQPTQTGKTLGSLLSSFPGRPAGPINAPVRARSMPSVQQADPSVIAEVNRALAQDKMAREAGSAQRFSPGAAAPPSTFPGRPAPSVRPGYGTTTGPIASPQQRMAGAIPASATVSGMLGGRNMPVSPAGPYAPATGPVAPPQATMEQQRAGYYDYGASLSRAPVTPVGRPATVAAPATPAALAKAATGLTTGTPSAPRVAAAPADFSPLGQANVPMVAQPNGPPIGAVNAPLGPNASPATLDAARKLGAAAAAYTGMPEEEAPAPAYTEPEAAPARTPAQAAVKAQATAKAASRPGAIPGGLAGPWGADISNQPAPGPWGASLASQPPSIDRMATGSVKAKAYDPAHPPGVWGKIGDFAQRNLPAIAGNIIAPGIGGLIGAGLGRMFDEAKPGQVFGNPFKGLANTARAMNMFQSQAPYAGPKTTIGYGTQAIGSVLGGGLPAGATAYSRSTPGYSVTSLGNGVVSKTNQYGFTSYERAAGTGPTRATFSGFGGMFGRDDDDRGQQGQQGRGWGGWGGFGGRSSSGKSGGGRSGGGGKSGGGGYSGQGGPGSGSRGGPQAR